MDVTKAPPSTDLTSLGVGTATSAAAASPNHAAADDSTSSNSSTAVAALADRVDIQPLDVAAALQILIAEVLAELPLPAVLVHPEIGTASAVIFPAIEPPAVQSLPAESDIAGVFLRSATPVGAPMSPGTRLAMPSMLTLLSSPAQASPVLMRMFLQAIPQGAAHPATWAVAVSQLENTLQSALDRAVSTVEQWHNVPQSVVDAARQTRGLVMSQLSEEAPGPLWLRPEWMWLGPQMERFRRRRRLARRGLSDPDWWPTSEEEKRQETPGEREEEP